MVQARRHRLPLAAAFALLGISGIGAVGAIGASPAGAADDEPFWDYTIEIKGLGCFAEGQTLTTEDGSGAALGTPVALGEARSSSRTWKIGEDDDAVPGPVTVRIDGEAVGTEPWVTTADLAPDDPRLPQFKSVRQFVAFYFCDAEPPAPPPPDDLFIGMVPTRLVDTRELDPMGPVPSGGDLEFEVGDRPVALNLTVTNPTGPGHAAVYPCAAGYAGTSSINFAAGETVANMVLASPDANGRLCVRVFVADEGRADVIVDQTGSFIRSRGLTEFGLFRAHDSRVPVFGHKLAAGEEISLSALEGAGNFLNLTVTEPEASGFLTVYPCGNSRPTTSTTNYVSGQTKASMTIAAGGTDDRTCIYTYAPTHLIVDTSNVILTPLAEFGTPERFLDTRTAGGRGHDFSISVGDAETTVVLNVTAVNPDAAGFVTVYPCGTTPPLASTLNYLAGEVVPNHTVITSDANGHVCFYSHATTDLVVDVVGYLNLEPE